MESLSSPKFMLKFRALILGVGGVLMSGIRILEKTSGTYWTRPNEFCCAIIRKREKLYAEMVYISNAIFLFPHFAWVKEMSMCNKIL